MAIPSGLSAQVGIKLPETVFGTYTAPDTFAPLVSEGVKKAVARIESKAIFPGARVPRSAQWAAGNVTIGGPVNLELDSLSIGKWLKAAFGTVVTAGAGPYTHTYTPGDLSDDFFTLQIGRPDVNGTVQPFSYLGTMIDQFELGSVVGEFVTFVPTVVAKDETTSQTLASASFSSGLVPMPFTSSGIKIATVAAKVKKVTLKGDNKLAKDRRFLGSALINQPLEAELRDYTGMLEMEFENLTNLNRFLNATEAALELTFAAGTQTLIITTNARWDGETPNVKDRGIIQLSLPFKCVGATTDAGAITAVYSSSEATP